MLLVTHSLYYCYGRNLSSRGPNDTLDVKKKTQTRCVAVSTAKKLASEIIRRDYVCLATRTPTGRKVKQEYLGQAHRAYP